ncbi:transmembrane emp24 domain-containing protein p24delta9 [Olea europaea var. sylvestris]|uniref:transmembrane emp24 domain-containing protein p24delta9 n=1 Tax=Olea europaea var. sylvestris TaxID=158386 RepID=UPI000C1D2B4B|nr:transmembrane emp24 domain-containing protein p24delta9 [Olea europaea var. sylvestris]
MRNPVLSIQFDLESGQTKCIIYWRNEAQLTLAKYHIVNPNEGHPLPDSHKTLVLTCIAYFFVVGIWQFLLPRGQILVFSISSCSFVLSKDECGLDKTGKMLKRFYMIKKYMKLKLNWSEPDHCKKEPHLLKLQDYLLKYLERVNTHMGWDGMGWDVTFDVFLLTSELKNMYKNVICIHDDMFYLCERKEEMPELNKSTNSKMSRLSFLSLSIFLSVAGLQIWHLMSFFEKKLL